MRTRSVAPSCWIWRTPRAGPPRRRLRSSPAAPLSQSPPAQTPGQAQSVEPSGARSGSGCACLCVCMCARVCAVQVGMWWVERGAEGWWRCLGQSCRMLRARVRMCPSVCCACAHVSRVRMCCVCVCVSGGTAAIAHVTLPHLVCEHTATCSSLKRRSTSMCTLERVLFESMPGQHVHSREGALRVCAWPACAL